MSITMNMSGYEIEADPMEIEYGAEILCSGWNPAVELVCQQQSFTPAEQQTPIPVDLVDVMADAFLAKMYAYQR